VKVERSNLRVRVPHLLLERRFASLNPRKIPLQFGSGFNRVKSRTGPPGSCPDGRRIRNCKFPIFSNILYLVVRTICVYSHSRKFRQRAGGRAGGLVRCGLSIDTIILNFHKQHRQTTDNTTSHHNIPVPVTVEARLASLHRSLQ
jgi:hypothetical protein